MEPVSLLPIIEHESLMSTHHLAFCAAGLPQGGHSGYEFRSVNTLVVHKTVFHNTLLPPQALTVQNALGCCGGT